MKVSSTACPPIICDVALIGCGPVGFVLSQKLRRLCPDLKMVIVDHMPRHQLATTKDHRTTTLSAHTCEVLEQLGLWDTLAPHAIPIHSIQTTDVNNPHKLLNFDATEVGKPFGYTLNNSLLRKCSIDHILQDDAITLLDGRSLDSIDAPPSSPVRITLTDGQVIQAQLLVGADGRFSKVRQLLMFDYRIQPYFQSALVGLIDHEAPHNGLAYEAFFPEGPTAFLPYKHEDTAATTTSAFVLCGPPYSISTLAKTDRGIMMEWLASRTPKAFGACSNPRNIQVYPLDIGLCKNPVREGVVLIGDAAHTIHPVAGQGMNLGIRDALALADHISTTRQLGLEIGNRALLQQYARSRWADMGALMMVTHGLVKIFGVNNPVVNWVRGQGLGAVNSIGPVKRFFMRRAMGYSK